MSLDVAVRAKCDEVLFHVTTRMTSKVAVVHLQVLHATADLASPVVALQYLLMQFAIALTIESYSRAFEVHLVHEAFRLTSARKTSCWGAGRN